jgi:hypothetical protein
VSIKGIDGVEQTLPVAKITVRLPSSELDDDVENETGCVALAAAD